MNKMGIVHSGVTIFHLGRAERREFCIFSVA